jgi:hypothetical protein
VFEYKEGVQRVRVKKKGEDKKKMMVTPTNEL